MRRLMSKGVFFAINTAEQVTQRPQIKPRFDLAGWGEYLRQDESFMDALEVIKIEHSIATALSPYQRIAFSLVTSAMTVSQTNAFLSRHGINRAPAAPATPASSESAAPAEAPEAESPPEPESEEAESKAALSLQPGVQEGAAPKKRVGRPRKHKEVYDELAAD